MLKRAYYSDQISTFLVSSLDEVLGKLARRNEFSLEQTQRAAWIEQFRILHEVLPGFAGSIYFEYSIPRMGQRIDGVLPASVREKSGYDFV